MALDLIPYHKKRVLIIEDLAEMRATMKSMLANMGVQHIETVNNGEEALAKLVFNQYDIVFSDYELGRGKDGQQILEEVRHSGRIPATTVYILVTAAQTMEMVMGALEYEPDGYITKPVTLEILRTRLNRIIRTKDVYLDINRAIDRKDINGALDACDRLALENPKFALPAYRIKGKLLLNENRLDEAKGIYDTALGIKRVAWAMLGLGKVLYLQGHHEEARQLLSGLANTRAQYVEAFDWLAKVLETQGNLKAAQETLEKAVETSPKAVLRQQELSRLAELNGDTEAMYKACRKAYALSKHSVFRNADILIRYAKTQQTRIQQGSMRDQKMATNEALSLLEQARLEFTLTLPQMFKSALLEAQTLFNSGREAEARLALRAALTMQPNPANLTADEKLDLFSTRLLLEEESAAMAYGNPLLKEIGNDHRLQSNYYRILDQHLVKQPAERVQMLKKRGTELLQRNEYPEAFQLLYKANRIDVTDTDAQLGALQAVIGLHRQGTPDPDILHKTTELLDKLQSLGNSDPRYPTLEKLRQQLTELNPDAASG